MKRGGRFYLVAGALLGAASFTPAWAEAETSEFPGTNTLVLRDFIATVSVVTDDVKDISVTIDNGDAGKEPVLVRQTGNSVEVYSVDEPDQRAFWKQMNWHRHGEDTFKVFLEDRPIVQITVPQGTSVELDGLASHLSVGNTDGAFDVTSTLYVEGNIGNVSSAKVRITDAGELNFASVAGALDATIAGSGTLSFNKVKTAEIGIAGSGDIQINSIDGPLSADIRGSGDIDVGDVVGKTDLRIAGSGDIEVGKIRGGADISIRGSGDIIVNEINGPSSVAITGNGDVEIKNGKAENLKVRITGSGDFDFNGLATNPDIRLSGNGDVFIKDYEGSLSTKGSSGDITIGDVQIDN